MIRKTQFSRSILEVPHNLCNFDCLINKQKTRFEVLPRGTSSLKEKKPEVPQKHPVFFLRVLHSRKGKYLGSTPEVGKYLDLVCRIWYPCIAIVPDHLWNWLEQSERLAVTTNPRLAGRSYE